MRLPLLIPATLIAVLAAGCASSSHSAFKETSQVDGGGGILANLVIPQSEPRSAEGGFSEISEEFRNDPGAGQLIAATPDFVDRRWMISRRREYLRVSNGRPYEYSTTDTHSVTRGPGG